MTQSIDRLNQFNRNDCEELKQMYEDMMSKFKAIFFLAVLVLAVSIAKSQNICGTDEYMKYKLGTDESFKKQFIETRKILKEAYLHPHAGPLKKSTTLYTIPVVIHVFHIGEAIGTGNNISDAQIIAAVQGLNDRFANVIGNSLDIQIQFCIASRDPNGCPTNGIVRKDASILPGYASVGMQNAWNTTCGGPTSQAVLDLSKWPVDHYLNIWVAKMCPGPAAYSSGIFGSPYAGVVMTPGSMVYSSDVLTHEVGHSLGLAHTWSGDNNNTTCPTNTNCVTDGDFICDTPPHKTGDCGATNPCTPLGVWDYSRYNYMSYCGPPQNVACFSPDQKTYMINFLTLLPCSTLVSSPGCNQPNFTPFTITKANVSCNSLCDGSISIAPLALCSPTPVYSYSWSTGGNTQSISNLCPGIYTVTVTNSLNISTVVTVAVTQPAPLSANIATTSLGCLTNGTVNVTGGSPYVSPTLCAASSTVYTVGNGTQLVSKTNYPSTYGNNFWSSKHQMLYLASELQALGITAGKISELAFNIFALNGQSVYNNYSISMKHTNLNAISLTLPGISTGLQTVFGPQSITLTSTGWNNHVFSNPFVWDGTSNIIIESCFSNSSSLSYSNTQIYMTNTSYLSCVSNNIDVLNGCSQNTGNVWDYSRKPNIRIKVCKDSLVYNYNWNNAQTTHTVSNLAPGYNFVTVTDGNGCATTLTFNAIMNVSAGPSATVYPASNTITIGGNPTATGNGPFTYTWIPAGSLNNSSVSNPTASPNVTTVYTVVAKDINGCTASSTVSIEVGSDIGLANYNKLQKVISISPNPTNGNVNLSSTIKMEEVETINALGQVILKKSVNSTNFDLDLSDFNNGIYFIRVSTELGTAIKKVIRE